MIDILIIFGASFCMTSWIVGWLCHWIVLDISYSDTVTRHEFHFGHPLIKVYKVRLRDNAFYKWVYRHFLGYELDYELRLPSWVLKLLR